MKRILALGLVVSLFSVPFAANAATKPSVVTAAFKTLLNTATNSMDALDEKYEADVDALDVALAEATKLANSTYDFDLLAASNQFAPLIQAANKKAEDSIALFNLNNKVTVGPGGGFFGGTNLSNYLDCLAPRTDGVWKLLKRYCARVESIPLFGTTGYGGEDWQPGDVTTIQLGNSGEPLVQNGIAAGYIIPQNLLLFDSSRIAYKQALADVASLTSRNGNARSAALAKQDKAISTATALRESELADLDDAYEIAKAQLEAQETAANLALLAAKRASKDASNFDKAFAVAYKFEYNRQMLNQIADDAWSGDWTFRTIDSIIKVSKLANTGDAIAKSYSMKNGTAFNSSVGNAFTNEPEFRAALKVLSAIYKKATNSTLKV